MPSRALLSSPPFADDHFRPRPTFPTKSKFLFLSLTISATAIIILTLLYFLYHLCHSFLLQLYHSGGQVRTIPFDAPLNKLKRFTYSELKLATNDFHDSSVIGRGGSATVFRAIAKDGKLYAVKRLDGDLTLHSEQEFQNELQILGGLKSSLLVTLLGYCVEKKHRLLVYEYMPNKSLQELLFGEDDGTGNVLSWERRFRVILDVSRALEFLHTGCDPPVIHGDVKPSNVLLDFDFKAKIADFGLSRVKRETELFSQDLMWKSQDLSGTLDPSNEEVVDFARALQASSSGKGAAACNFNGELNFNSVKGKEVPGDEHSKELNCGQEEEELEDNGKQWGKDWWWRQDGNEEFCSKDYVMEWIGSQISPSSNPNWEEEQGQDHKSITPAAVVVAAHLPTAEAPPCNGLESKNDSVNGGRGKKNRKMKEWWKEEHLEEMSKKGSFRSSINRLKVNNNVRTKLKIRFHRRKRSSSSMERKQEDEGEFSFRRGWRRKKKSNNQNGNDQPQGSEMWSGDLFSRELSSTTTSMRGTLCYVAPEHGGGAGVSCGGGGGGYLMEKADIYSLGVLILVIVSGRRPLHVLASPMKLEKANLISWCRQLAHQGSNGDILEIVDERLKEDYNKEEASLCINLALICLQKMPELRPEIGDIVRILKGEMEIPPLPFEFSPSPPPSKLLLHKSGRKYRAASTE